jgi:peptidoglycan hydrolase CwlO-like protein
MRSLRPLLPLAVLLALLLGGPPARAQDSLRDAASRLRAAVAAEEAKIADTREGLADAERRLGVLDARVGKRRAQLDATQDKLVTTRARLTKLERKQAEAETLLAQNLRSSYMSGEANLVTVVMNADGFTDLVERFEFLRRIARRNASVLGDTRAARIKVKGMTNDLKALRTTYSVLARNAQEDRNQADAIRTALLRREQTQLRRRDGAQAQLVSVRNRIAAIERRQAAAARRARAAATALTAAPRVTSGASTDTTSGTSGNTGAGTGGGGDVVARVVAAASEIATTPYVWGGGHGGASGGYDCSGSISYALAAAGLLSGSLDSTGFMSWGDAGPGRRITVYANAGHAFMVVDGRRYDTSALSGGGTRWTSAMRSTAGFVARHPPGL